MPSIKPLTENERKDKFVREQLAGKMRSEKVSQTELARLMGISSSTLYRKIERPETFTLREQRIIQGVFPDIQFK